MDPSLPNDALVRQFLAWIGREPKSYAETIEAWRTSCPRLTVWEDAVDEGLVERMPAASADAAEVRVTPKGRALMGW